MTDVRTDVRSDEIRQTARHTLFVEGSSQDSIDPEVLRLLLHDTGIRIEPMGSAYSIWSAAEALHPHHPDYYFLVDRDHQDKETVEKSWRNFPDSGTHNLLIWRRRELESYFLILEYLSNSSYLTCKTEKLRDVIIETVNKRIFLDAANIVIVWLRERLKKNWIELFDTARGFESKESALKELLNRNEFSSKKRSVALILQENKIKNKFEQTVDELLGGQGDIKFDYGSWLEMTKAKRVLPTVIDKCFKVIDAEGNKIQGKEALIEVVKDLLRRPIEEQPSDFQELHRLISNRVIT